MKKVTNRCLALLLIAAMTLTSLPQSMLTVTAAEITENAENTESMAETVSETADSDSNENLSDIPSDETDIVEGEPTEGEGALEGTDTDDTLPEEQPDASETPEDVSNPDEADTEDIEKVAPELDDIEDVSMDEDIIAQPEMAVNVPEADRTQKLASGAGYSGNIEWFLDMDGILEVTGEGELVGSSGNNMPWYSYRTSIKAARFIDVSGVTIAANLFYGCTNLKQVDLSGFDTSNVTTMYQMFYNCSALTDLDLDGWKTEKVTSMTSLFNGCSTLTELDLSSWNTSSLTSVSRMFYDCKKLTKLNLEGFIQNGGPQYFNWTFYNCYKLTDLNISNWDVRNVIEASETFYCCYALTSLDLSGWDVSNVTTMKNMFYECSALTDLNLSGWNTGKVTTMERMFYECRKLTDLNVSGLDVSSVTTMYQMFYNCTSLVNLDLSDFVTSKLTDLRSLFNGCSALESLDISSFVIKDTVINISSMFYGCTSLVEIVNPANLGKGGISLPSGDTAWRRPDGKRAVALLTDCDDVITLTRNEMAGIGFKGENYTVQDTEGNPISLVNASGMLGEKVVDIGTSEEFSFILKPSDGYRIKSVTLARTGSTITLEKGALPNQYTIQAADEEGGYVRDEQINVEAAAIENFNLSISYDEDVIDIIVANGSDKTTDEGDNPTDEPTDNPADEITDGSTDNPKIVQVSNGYDTTLYVKIRGSEGDDPLEPLVYIKADSSTQKKEVAYLKNTDDMSGEEKEWYEKGYFILPLGSLYENMSLQITERFPLSDDDIKSGVSKDVRWVIDKNGRLKVKGRGDWTNSDYYYMPWSSYAEQITSAVIDWTGATTAKYLFDDCSNLTEANLSNFDTKNVTTMYDMFNNCQNLTSLDLSSFDTQNVTDMTYMFSGCQNLTSLDLNSFDTQNVTNMYGMFYNCKNLTELKLTNFNTQKVTDMPYMFYECQSLPALDLSSFDTQNVTNMYDMFYDCKNLTELKLTNFNTQKITDMSYMFYECQSLLALDLSSFDTKNVTNMYGMFYDCKNLTELKLTNFNTLNVTDMSHMFYECQSLPALDLSSFNTQNVTNMSYMFYNCKSLTALDLSNFDMSSAYTYVSYMLDLCSSLEEIKTPRNLVACTVYLPSNDNTRWRRSDGTEIYYLPDNETDSITVTTRKAELNFNYGDRFILKDSEGKTIDNKQVLVDRGSKEAFTFIIEPKEDYLLESVEPESSESSIKIEKGTEPYHYIVSPSDAENGYVRDERIRVNTKLINHYSMSISSYSSEYVDDVIVVNGDSWTENKPESVSIVDIYDTALYVKVKENENDNSGIRIPVINIESRDELGNWYNKTIVYQSDTSSMTEKEQELVKNGYYAFTLGKLYGDTRIYTDFRLMYSAQFKTSGFPGDVKIIQYTVDGDGTAHKQECKDKLLAVNGEPTYFQVEWSDTPEGDFKWCKPSVMLDSNELQLENHSFNGVEELVWSIKLCDDVTVNIGLTPHTISLDYAGNDIKDLSISNTKAELTEDKRAIVLFGGDELSLSFKLADGIEFNGAACDGGVLSTRESEGTYTLTVQDMSNIQKINSIVFNTQDPLNRYLLSDLMCQIDYDKGSVSYTGKPIEPKIRKVTVYPPDSKKGIVLKENTDYTVSYLNNTNVGTALVVITAKEDSKRYRGSCYEPFEITRAASPTMDDIAVQVDADNAGTTQQLDLSELITLNTQYESGVKPIGYELDTSDNMFSLGDILKSNPTLQGSIMTYSTWADAGKNSQSAVIVVRAYFENYTDARVVLRINLVKKEDLVLAGTIKADNKIYDGNPVAINADGIYVESVSGQKPANPGTIMDSIKDSLSYRYTGIDGTVYDSKTAPVDVGSYKVSVAVSEEHMDYRSEYVDAGTFTISKRNVEIAADNLNLYIGDTKQEYYSYTIMGDGLAEGNNNTPPILRCETLDMSQIGEYPITIDVTGVRIYNSDGIDVTNNYNISGKAGVVNIAYPKEGSYTVIYNLSGHGANIVRSGNEPGSLLRKPMDPVDEGYTFLGWYKDETLSTTWNFDIDTIQEDMTLYAGWSIAASEDKGMTLCVQEIAGQRYTGAAIKPAVTVYSGDGKTLLKLGKDYTLSYKNNIEADTSEKKFGTGEVPRGGIGVSVNKNIDKSEGFNDNLAYVTITGKGSYTGTVCMNFHINAVPISTGNTGGENMPAAGFTLKYTDQFETKAGKNAKVVSSLKYKKALKLGSDYTLEVYKDNQPVSLTGKGELPLNEGAYILTITGKGNYTGLIRKNLYVTSKDKMMKNAKITYDKALKNVTREQLKAGVTQTNVQVSLGSLTSNDYVIKYYNNHSIGTATMVVTGTGNNYVGSKSVTFKIQGTTFKENEFRSITLADIEYNGAAIVQNGFSLITQSGEELIYGTDYTVEYKNNTKKGKATMIFTAKPSSGYSGSFKKTFAINPLSLDSDNIIKGGTIDNNSKLTLENSVPYRKGGAKPSNKLSLYVAGTQVALTEGKDYTVRYNNNLSTGKANMTLTGKGNFSGSITVDFDIEYASLAQLYNEGEITITASSMRIAKRMRYVRDEDEGWWEDTQDSDKEYKPAVTVKDGKQKLTQGTDYSVYYFNNTHGDVSGEDGAASYAEIRGMGSYGDVGGGESDAIIVPLSIYQKSISASTLYIVYNDGFDYTYTGEQVMPTVTVYYGKSSDISKAKKANETDEGVLTTPKPDPADYERGERIPYEYGLVRLSQWQGGTGGGDFALTYGTNIAPGKNGIINIKGIGAYSGSASIKFNIDKKPIYKQGSSEE